MENGYRMIKNLHTQNEKEKEKAMIFFISKQKWKMK